MWQNYFNFIKLVPGKVVVKNYGIIDFSKDNVPVDVCKKLYESGFRYLEITEFGNSELYGIKPQQVVKSKKKNNTVKNTKPASI